jgi:glycosyltransferase involved in cell wall biosynthesis
MPSYPEIRLALVGQRDVERRLDAIRPDAVHIATEGPIGHAVRRVCLRRGLPFTTSFHTRFPDYLAERLPVPERWTSELTWGWLRRFHSPGAMVMAATPTLACELATRGFHHVRLWPRGVDAELFRPRAGVDLKLPRPIFLTVGRLAVEKNLEAFLALDLPGTKVVVGDGPSRASLERKFPNAVFVGARRYQQESFVGISRLFVMFRTGGRLAQTENVIGLAAIDGYGAAHLRQAARHPVFVVIDHRQTSDSDGFVLIQSEGRAKLFDR